GGEREISVVEAPTWGFGRTIQAEHPELGCKLVDVDPASVGRDVAALAAELFEDDGEDQLALRSEGRFVARLVPSQPRRADGGAPRLRPDASYLVTGALGGLGLSVAEWMVQRGARH